MASFVVASKSEVSRPLASGAAGNEVEITATLTGPTSYTSGGETFTQAVIRLLFEVDSISHFVCEELDNTTTLRKLTYDRSANKLRAWLMASTVEGTNGTGTQVIYVEQTGSDNLSTFTYRVRFTAIRRNLTPLV